MDSLLLAPLSDAAAAGIVWIYLVTNSARILTYLPQIVAVWRCRDGAHAISLFTWYSWVASNLASIAYGVLVIHDVFFVAISAINFAGCAAVAGLATRRRCQCDHRVASSQPSTHGTPLSAPAVTCKVVREKPDGALPQRAVGAPLRRRTDIRPAAAKECLELAAR